MMDMNQAARMIEWLDEERRRDKTLISALEERLAQQSETVLTLTKRLSSLESDQTVLQAQMQPVGREAELLDMMRRDVQQAIEGVESKRLLAEREAERRAELARDNVMRPVRDLGDRLDKLERATSTLPAQQVERERLTDSLGTLQQRVDDLLKKLEEPERRIAFLEEQRRQDTRRISEVQSEQPEFRKQLDMIRPKITLLEELALRTERRVQETQNAERERRDQIQQFIDQQTLIVQQRDQQVTELTKRFGEQDSAMQRNIERFETWSETYRSMKKIVDDFERIGDRLERRIGEVAEMQRLSEERFRQEWNSWTAEDQRRWKSFTISNDEVWRNHDKEFERFVQHMQEVESQIPTLADNINRLWNLERARVQMYRERYQALLLEHDTGGKVTTSAVGKPNTPLATSTTNIPPVNLTSSNGS